MSEKKENTSQGKELPEPSFLSFLSGMATEILIQLGEIENPITRKKEVNLPQARYSIDLLSIIEEKTRGNLTPEEQKYLDAILYQVRMMFVNKTKKEGQRNDSSGKDSR